MSECGQRTTKLCYILYGSASSQERRFDWLQRERERRILEGFGCYGMVMNGKVDGMGWDGMGEGASNHTVSEEYGLYGML